jgi:hypothetical protein
MPKLWGLGLMFTVSAKPYFRLSLKILVCAVKVAQSVENLNNEQRFCFPPTSPLCPTSRLLRLLTREALD